MGVKIKIPRQEIKMKEINSAKSRTGKSSITMFNALGYDVTSGDYTEILAPCEAFGDHKAELEAAIASGEPLEIDSAPEWSEQWSRYSIKMPWKKDGGGGGSKWSGGGGGGGSWGGGGKKYDGKVVSYEAWWTHTDAVTERAMKSIVNGLMSAFPTTEVGVYSSPEVIAATIASAQDLVATWQIAMKDNVTYFPGCEPAATPAPPTATPAVAAPPAAAAGPSQASLIAPAALGVASNAILAAIYAADYEYNAVKALIDTAQIPADEKGTLYQKNVERSREKIGK